MTAVVFVYWSMIEKN